MNKNDWMFEVVTKKFEYNHKTGELTHKVDKRGGGKSGTRAGSVDKDGYRRIGLWMDGKVKTFYEHRIVWLMCTGNWPTTFIDHINCNKTDNRIENLREATQAENQMNKPKQSNNTTGFKGVDFHKKVGRFRARVRLEGKRYDLGYFDTAEEAHAAYCVAAMKMFGGFFNSGE